MPPVRRTGATVDPVPLLAASWRAFAAAVAELPDEALPIPVLAGVVEEIAATRRDLHRLDRPDGAARSLAEYLSAVRHAPSAPSPAPTPRLAPTTPITAPMTPPTATPTATDPPELRRALAAAVDDASGFLAESSAPAVSSAAGSVLRSVYLEHRLISAVAAGRSLPDPLTPERPVLRHCVRVLARALAELAPGHAVELRVPPHVAVQCVEGPRHTRGTPPNVVEIDPLTFVDLAIGRLDWSGAASTGRIRASGERADLRMWLPLWDVSRNRTGR
jgi:hypothetical protein